MKGRVFFSAFLVLLMCGMISAQQISEADAYYVSAQNYLKNDDYKNALRSVHLARVIYANLSNMDAVKQCDILITDIGSNITPSMRAAYYYRIAEDYFFEADDKPSLDLWTKTVYFASLARDEYSALGDQINTQRSEDIRTRAKNEIDKYFSTEKIKANTYYNIARTNFIEKNYTLALSYAENASLIYSLIPDADGIERSQTLIRSINERIEEVRQNAQTVCDTSMELYNSGNMTGADIMAKKCKSMYESINHGPGVLTANKLITLITQFLDVTIQRKKDNARALYSQAQDAFVRKEYANASESVRQSREIYQELYDETPEREGVIRGSYKAFIEDCDRLNQEILTAWGYAKIMEQAEKFFTQAQKYYIDQYFDEALTYAKRATSLFDDLQYFVGVSKANSLIDTINKRVDTERMGDGNLSAAKEYLMTADFDNALVHATRARAIYETLMGSNKTLYADEVLTAIADGVKKKEEAAGLYNRGYEEFNAGNFEEAKSASEQAYAIYVAINYSIGISESKSLLDRASDKVAENKAKQRTIILAVLIVIVVLAILIVKYMKRKKEMEAVAKKDEEERKEREKREKKVWEAEKEVEAKKLAEEKFKKMVAEEMDIIGEEKAAPEKESKEDII